MKRIVAIALLAILHTAHATNESFQTRYYKTSPTGEETLLTTVVQYENGSKVISHSLLGEERVIFVKTTPLINKECALRHDKSKSKELGCVALGHLMCAFNRAGLETLALAAQIKADKVTTTHL